MKEVVAIVGPVDETGRKTIKENLPEQFIVKEINSEEEYSMLNDVNYVILRTLKMNSETIKALPNLKLIQRWGVGYDSVDIKAAGDKGIQVAVTSGINATPVAEYAVLLMLCVFRNIIPIHQNVVTGKWRNGALIDRSYVINGKKVGLVGLGSIGKQVAHKLKAFGAEVSYYDAFRLPEEQEKSLDITYLPFDELIKKSDIISLHVPLTNDTKNLINKDVFSKMKSTAIIVNTARGGIINEQDLYEALSKNQILGAGIDVFENEPLSMDNPLLKLNNVVLSAHSAGNTVDNSFYMGKRCVENILHVSKNEPLINTDLVNAQYLKKLEGALL
ncbi:MAG: 3-phosphoglycerate dehydrogenase [Clostridiales bacterium]|nr:3-phosphoglycerate dehydrogenase [Clostridiales bacterium]